MNILTISASPYLLTKLGTINSCLLSSLGEEHKTATACWDHDVSYFMPEDENNPRFYFTSGEKKICEIYPIQYQQDRAVVDAFEVMKAFQPDVVISIGDYYETAWVHAIKRQYPQLFKWVAVLTVNAFPMNKEYEQAFEFADAIVTTNEASAGIWREGMPDISVCRFGPDHSVFNQKPDRDAFRVMASAKNSQSSNAAAFIQACGEAMTSRPKIEAYLHTNVNDFGDYDLDDLIERLGGGGCIDLPDKFVSLNEGLSREELASEYARSAVYADFSVQSATGLGVLEAMACGCVPLVSGATGIREVVEEIGRVSHCRLVVNSLDFVGARGEVIKIVDPIDAATQLLQLYNLWENRIKEFEILSDKCRDIAQRYSKDTFVKVIKGLVNSVLEQPRMKLAVETM